MGARVMRRARWSAASNAGFGLVELLIAMTVLTIGILAIAATFSSGAIALRRASRISTGSALADAQVELYRALTYTNIRLDPTSIPGAAPYTTDPAYSASQVTTPACPGLPPECNASRTVTGADGLNYRVDTYIVYDTPTSGHQDKKVTVVVRDSSTTTITYARAVTTFDQTTGT